MKSLLSTVLAAAMIGITALAADAAGSTTTSVRSFSDGSVVPGSSASLVRTDSGVSATLSTSGLPAGDVVTLWWVVFNHPENCAGPSAGHPFQCGRSDLGNPAVEASVLLPPAVSLMAPDMATTAPTSTLEAQAALCLVRGCSCRGAPTFTSYCTTTGPQTGL